MASTPMMPPNAYGGAPAAPPLPGTDMTSICFRDQLWLNTYPLDRNLIFDYFALSPFYDWTCNNEQLRARAIHSLDFSHISKMTGIEYTLSEVMEPNIFVIRKQKRDSPEEGHTNADLLHLGWFNIPSSTALQRVFPPRDPYQVCKNFLALRKEFTFGTVVCFAKNLES